MKISLKQACISVALAFSLNPVGAHPLLVLPAHHATLLAAKAVSHVVPLSAHSTGIVNSQKLLALLTKSKGGSSLQGLSLSGSQKAFLAQDKLVVQNGFSGGLAKLANASILNGALNGHVYILEGSGSYVPFGTNYFAIGSNNPLNVGGPTTSTVLHPNGPSFISLKGISSARSLINVLGKSTTSASLVSGASKAALARFKGLTEASARLGGGANGGVITNGQIAGTFYDGATGGNYVRIAKTVVALANNPLNTNPVPFASANPASFLDYGKYQYNISSGEIFSTVYFGNNREGVLFALGSDKLNNYPFGPSSIHPTSLFSSLVGKLVYLKTH